MFILVVGEGFSLRERCAGASLPGAVKTAPYSLPFTGSP